MKPITLAMILACLGTASPAFALEPASTVGAAQAALPMERRVVLLVDEIRAPRNVPVLVAERLGYFKDAGMDILLVNTRNEVSHAQLLYDGKVDAIMAYYHHTIVNSAAGNQSQAVVTLGVTPGARIMVANRVKQKFTRLQDLKGARVISGGAGSSKTTLANYLVLQGGHALTDYTRTGTDGKDANVAALRDGSADLVVAPTPDGTLYERSGVASVFADLTTPAGTRQHLGVLFPSSTVYMASARVKAHPEIAQHLANVFVRALRYMNTHTAEEIAALMPVEATGKDMQAYLAILREQLPMFATDGRMPEDGAKREWEVLSAATPGLRGVPVESTYTNRFVDEALKRVQ